MAIAGGWHGDGVIDPEIKHDNEPCLFCFFSSLSLSLSLSFFTLLSSSLLVSASLKFPRVKKKKEKKKH